MLVEKIPHVNRAQSPRAYHSMSLNPINPPEVTKIIKSLKISGDRYEAFSSALLKKCNEPLAPIIAALVTHSMGTGVFPTDKLKIARVLPILKQGDKMQPGTVESRLYVQVWTQKFGRRTERDV